MLPMSSSHHPLDLPEIRQHLAKFLNRHDLTVCARVSRDWNRSFQPRIWQRLRLVSHSAWTINTKEVPLSTFVRNAEFIQRLDTYGGANGFLQQVACAKLQVLTIRQWEQGPQALVIHQFQESLTELSFDIVTYGQETRNGKTSHDSWEAAASCPLLEKLAVTEGIVAEKDWDLCSSVWSRLRKLRLLLVKFYIPNDGPISLTQDNHDRPRAASHFGSLPLTKIKDLMLTNIAGFSCLEDELEFLRLCPDLEKFEWYPDPSFYRSNDATTGNQIPIGNTFADMAQLCPKLRRIRLSLDATREDEILPFLESRADGSLEGLTMDTSSWFGEPSWRIVQRRHCSSLRVLNVHQSTLMKGVWVQEILCELPHLEVLYAPWLQDVDIENDPRPWVCLGLTKLVLCIDLVKTSSQRTILERLATLRRLKYWDFSRTMTRPTHKNYRATSDLSFLQLSLSHGLDLLGTLRCLETLMLFETSQTMDENDVRWISEHWPRLKTLRGVIHPSGDIHRSLWTILSEHDVGVRQEVELHIVK